MPMKKRIVSASVCAVLLIAGGAVDAGAHAGYAGAGNGADLKVEKLETLKEVIDALSEIQSGKRTYALTRDAEGQELPKNEYTSCTVTEISDVYSTFSSYSQEENVAFSRTLNMYYDENASFYESDVQLSSSSYASKDSTDRHLKTTLDMQVKVYISEDCAMYCLTRMNYSYLENYQNRKDLNESYVHTERDTAPGITYGIMKEYCNQWVDCSENPQTATAFLRVNNSNLQTLSEFADLIEEQTNAKENDFRQSGNVYTLKEEAMLKFFGLYTYRNDADIKGSLTIDLSAETKPEISYWISSSMDKSYMYGSDTLHFKNINNTTVKKPNASVNIQTILKRAEEALDALEERT